MTNELTSVTVRIYGWDYTLKVEPSQVERAKEIAEYLDQRMQLIAKKTGSADTLKISIRSALTIVDEVFTLQEKLNQLEQAPPPAPVKEENPEWQQKLNELSSRIDQELQEL